MRKRDDIVEALFKGVEDNAEDERRGHMGASGIGADCPRQAWYDYRWIIRRDHAGRMLRLWKRGHREEEAFIHDLRLAGFRVLEVNEETEKQFSFSRLWGHFGGSIDSALQDATGAWYLLEFKTYNLARFRELQRHGVQDTDSKYWTQLHVYMGLSGLRRAFFFAVCKNDDHLHCEEVEYNPQVFEYALTRAEELIYTETPPPRITSNPSYYICKWCDYHAICHLGDGDVAPSCRTCANGRPSKGEPELSELTNEGKWVCLGDSSSRSIEDQKTGCNSYRTALRILD